MKIYIAGKITGLENYKEIFDRAQEYLEHLGHSIMNPATLHGKDFTHDDYMHVCYSMMDICDAVYFLDNWVDSKGAKLEHEYAVKKEKWIKYQKGVIERGD